MRDCRCEDELRTRRRTARTPGFTARARQVPDAKRTGPLRLSTPRRAGGYTAATTASYIALIARRASSEAGASGRRGGPPT